MEQQLPTPQFHTVTNKHSVFCAHFCQMHQMYTFYQTIGNVLSPVIFSHYHRYSYIHHSQHTPGMWHSNQPSSSSQNNSHFSRSCITHPSTLSLKTHGKASTYCWLWLALKVPGVLQETLVQGIELQLRCLQVFTWTCVHLSTNRANCIHISGMPIYVHCTWQVTSNTFKLLERIFSMLL